MTRIVSLAALTVLELPPPALVRCAADAGYTHVGIRLVPATPEEPAHASVGDTPLIRETLARLRDTGVAVLDVEILRLLPDTRVGAFAPVLETAARLGARNALVAGDDPEFARLVDRFGQLCDLAAPFGIAVCLEPISWTHTRDFAQGARTLRAAGRPDAGLVIDPLHFDRGGSTASELAGVPAEWLRYAQVCDAPAARPETHEGLIHQARHERLLPGEGGLDLPGIFRALARDMPVSVEIPMATLARTVPPVERARRALRATRALLDGLG